MHPCPLLRQLTRDTFAAVRHPTTLPETLRSGVIFDSDSGAILVPSESAFSVGNDIYVGTESGTGFLFLGLGGLRATAATALAAVSDVMRFHSLVNGSPSVL